MGRAFTWVEGNGARTNTRGFGRRSIQIPGNPYVERHDMSVGVVYATFSTWVTPTVQIERGQIWDADDPVVKSHPDWFTADPSEFTQRSGMYVATREGQNLPEKKPARTATVEAATAAPGEKRTVSPRADK